MTSTTKRRALIIIPSARELPLAEPASVSSISTGFFLVELAQILREFEHDYQFTFATPDGNPPQLDINGMGLAFHAIEKLGQQTAITMLQQRGRSFEIDRYRQRRAALIARREQELRLLERHLGRLPVSEVLPNTDREAAAFRPELVRRLATLPEQTFPSVEALVRRHRDPHDQFSFADFDFIHAPGGHAPMVDFRDNPLARRSAPPRPRARGAHLAHLPCPRRHDLHLAASRPPGQGLPPGRESVPGGHDHHGAQARRASR